MGALTCDVCNGSLSMDASGDFAVCQSCGMKYAKDSLKAKNKEVTGTVEVSNIAGIESLMKRGNLLLEDSDWKQANVYFDKVLDINPEYALAYVGKLCTDVGVGEEELLGISNTPLSNFANFEKALRFADAEHQARLKGYNQTIIDRLERERLAAIEKFRALKRRELLKMKIGMIIGGLLGIVIGVASAADSVSSENTVEAVLAYIIISAIFACICAGICGSFVTILNGVKNAVFGFVKGFATSEGGGGCSFGLIVLVCLIPIVLGIACVIGPFVTIYRLIKLHKQIKNGY